MYELILVDDQEITIQTLSTLYNWESYGFHLAAIFTDGEEARDYLTKHHVDLIVSDIRMPFFDGLDLAHFCHTNFPDSLFILLSAYRDFEYAQKAINYNVIRYLTKPLDFSLFEKTLISAFQKLEANSKQKNSQESSTAFRQHFLSFILGNDTFLGQTQQELSIELEKFQIDPTFLNNECASIIFQLDDFASYTSNVWKYGNDRLLNAISFLFPSDPGVFHFMLNSSFDIVEFLCFNIENNDDFTNKTQKSVKIFTQNLSEILHLELKDVSLRYAKSFTEIHTLSHQNENAVFANSTIEKALAYIEDNFNRNLSLIEMAEYIHLHPTYFSNFFKQYTGINFSTYLKNIRINKALEYLRNTDLPVYTICELVGYKNTTRFYNLMRNEYHMSPSEYRTYWKEKGCLNE